jgi:hypothetical protein
MAARFDLGVVVATPGALELLRRYDKSPDEYLDRHVSGDWGDLGAYDWQANDQALQQGTRLFSAYAVSPLNTLWIIIMWNVQSPGSVFGTGARGPTRVVWGQRGSARRRSSSATRPMPARRLRRRGVLHRSQGGICSSMRLTPFLALTYCASSPGT